MHIKCAGLQGGEDIKEIDEQIEEDIRTADACTRLGIMVHAFGDGATRDKEGIPGWGVQLQRWEGGVIIEDHGRTPGIQQNDASSGDLRGATESAEQTHCR